MPEDEGLKHIETDLDKKLNKKVMMIAIIGLLLGVACAASFFIGAATICERSGGTMLLPLACFDIAKVEACKSPVDGSYIIDVPTNLTK